MPRESVWENTEIPEQKKVKNPRPPGATQNTKASQAHKILPTQELHTSERMRTQNSYKSLISRYKKDTENPNLSLPSEECAKRGEYKQSRREIHKQGTNTPIQTLVRHLFRVSDSRKPITWGRMKFVLWARYNKLSPFIRTSRGTFTFSSGSSRDLSGWSRVCLRG